MDSFLLGFFGGIALNSGYYFIAVFLGVLGYIMIKK